MPLVYLILFLAILGYCTGPDHHSDNSSKSVQLADTQPTDPIPELPPKTIDSNPIDLNDKSIYESPLSPRCQEIIHNLKALKSQNLEGFKVGKIIVGKTTVQEAKRIYPSLDSQNIGSSHTFSALHIDFPLGDAKANIKFDGTSRVIEEITIESSKLDQWNKFGLQRHMQLNKYIKRVQKRHEGYIWEIKEAYSPKGMRSKAKSKSDPIIEIKKSQKHNKILLRFYWPFFSRSEFDRINSADNFFINEEKKQDRKMNRSVKDYFSDEIKQ